jgi:hypothetical protein
LLSAQSSPRTAQKAPLFSQSIGALAAAWQQLLSLCLFRVLCLATGICATVFNLNPAINMTSLRGMFIYSLIHQ